MGAGGTAPDLPPIGGGSRQGRGGGRGGVVRKLGQKLIEFRSGTPARSGTEEFGLSPGHFFCTGKGNRNLYAASLDFLVHFYPHHPQGPNPPLAACSLSHFSASEDSSPPHLQILSKQNVCNSMVWTHTRARVGAQEEPLQTHLAPLHAWVPAGSPPCAWSGAVSSSR